MKPKWGDTGKKGAYEHACMLSHSLTLFTGNFIV